MAYRRRRGSYRSRRRSGRRRMPYRSKFRGKPRIPTGHGSTSRMTVGERKHFDVNLTGTINDDGTNLTWMNAVPGGSSIKLRLGSRFYMTSFHLQGRIQGEATTLPQVFGLIIFLDRHPDGTAPTAAELLETVDPLSFLKTGNSARFRVLKRIRRFVSGTTSATGSNTNSWVIINCNLSFKPPIPVQWDEDTTTADAADIRSNALYVLVLTTEADASTNNVIASVHGRLRFVDG